MDQDLKPTHRSDDYASGRFAPHGSAEARADGRIARFCATGPFNIEGARAISAMSKALFESLPPDSSYGNLVIARGSMLAPLEAVAEFGSLLSHARALGQRPVGFAIVAGPDVAGRNIIDAMLGKLRAATAPQFALFDDEAQAMAWLELRLEAQESGRRWPDAP